MKKLCLAVAVAMFSVLSFAGEKVDIKFSGKIIEKAIKRKICVIKDDVMSIGGDNASKHNDWRAVVFPLPFKAPAGKEFVFSGDVKGEKIQGKLWVAIRLVKTDGKTYNYEVHAITKDQDWQAFTKKFTVPAKIVKLQFYIIGRKLANDSIASVKNLSIEQLN